MRRMRIRKKYLIKKFSLGNKIILLVFLLFIILFFAFKYISNSVTPALMTYAEVEAKKFINAIIVKAVDESKIDNVNNLFIISKTDEQINTIDFNVNSVNSVLTGVSNKIQESIKLMESGQLDNLVGYDNEKLKKGVIYEIPSGLVFKNNILSNLGPKVPVKISLRGNILSNIDTKVTNYGINNALIEVKLNLNMSEQVVLPFTLKTIDVNSSIPIAIKLIEGSVPKYYSGGLSESSPILSLPLE